MNDLIATINAIAAETKSVSRGTDDLAIHNLDPAASAAATLFCCTCGVPYPSPAAR